MQSTKKMQEIISLILLTGTLLSAILVIIGGTLYLWNSGGDLMQSGLSPTATPMTVRQIWEFALSFTPLGIIELGLLTLVATQSARVALLCWFYAMIRDYKFFSFSMFILIVLIYSSFWRN